MKATQPNAEAGTAKDSRIQELRVLKFTDLKTYLELRNDGWETIWAGEGKIALRPTQE